MFASTIILFLGIAVFIIWGQIDSRQHLVYDLYCYADIIGDNCKASLAFSDEKDAEQTLSTIQAEGSIVFACIYDKEGRIFTQYQRVDIAEKIQPPQPQKDRYYFENGHLSVFKQIELDGEMVGIVYLLDDMSEIRSRLARDAAVAGGTMLSVLAIAYLLSSKLQKVISTPILSLSKAAKDVSAKKDYSIRVSKQSNDEIGRLVGEFNNMLEQIQQHQLTLGKELDERKKTEKALREREQKFQAIFNQSFQFIGLMKTDGTLIEVNKTALSFVGLEESDVLNKPFWETPWWIHSPELQEQLREAVSKAAAGQFIRFEATHPAEDGGIHYVDFSLKPVKDEKGNVVLLIPEGRDITERKQAEEAIKTAYEQLEQANMELKEMQSQLVQNEKLASIGQLAAGVAHEMNTPVGFVASNFRTLENYLNKFLELLAGYKEVVELVDTGTKEERLTKLQEITETHNKMKIDFILEDIQGLFDESREGLDRVTSIVQNLRDFSRIDQPGSRDEYDINKGIEATLVVANNEIKYNADVKTDFSEVPLIFCHSGQINQVFLNILVNAAQAIKAQKRDGNGTITIRTHATETKVICEIEDDGPGIPPDKLSKIFDPFFTTKPVGKGTGLGLSVSYDIIVNKHNGKLLVDSTVGEGTKFTIKLPIGTKENSEKEKMNDGKENSIICG
jgi:PAS domain S-box-containing protein